jgi:chromosome segregation ATPase
MDLAKFDLLAERLETLITRLKESQERIKGLEDELSAAQKEITSLNEERVVYIKKTDKLLNRLEEFLGP